MTGYIGIGGKAKKVNSLYVGIGGKAKKVIKGYVGVGGKAKLWYSAQKLWTWEKHNIDTTTVYVEVTGSTSSTTRSSAFYVGSTYSLNSSTGQFTVNQTTQIANSSTGATNATNKYYITLTSTSGSQTGSTVYKITNATYSSSYRRLTLTLQAIGSQSQTQQSMGSLIGTVTDADITTYPINGPQDGYWYVLAGIPSFTYSGSYNSNVVEMDDEYYLLLELTSSGTLTLGGAATADIWICGGGGTGEAWGANGGGGGYAATSTGASFQNLVVTIGAGGVYPGYSSHGYVGVDGNSTSISGNVSLSANGGKSGKLEAGYYGNGGSGGGIGGYNSYGNSVAGSGDGIAKKPFGSSYFSYPFCDGGGGGGFIWNGSIQYNGGAGGTNGGNGSAGSSGYGGYGGAGGGHYGGAGGAYNAAGSAATGYGSGGGGGGRYKDELRDAGNGYQGVCFIRIPFQ